MAQIDLRRLRLLRELRDRGTVTAVGTALHLTSSAVSQQLAALSRDVGAPLLEPHGRRVRLTDAARLLLRHADILFAQLERAQTEIDAHVAGAAGTVRVVSFATAVPALAVPLVHHLAVARPALTIALHEADTDVGVDRLLRDDTDVAIALDGGLRVDDQRFTRLPLLVDPMDVALPARHPLAAEPALRLADLADQPWIISPGGLCRDLTLRECAVAGFTPSGGHAADSWEATIAMVGAGLGVALVPRMAIRAADPAVAVRVLRAEQPRRRVVLLVRRGGDRAPHMRAVLDGLRQVADAYAQQAGLDAPTG
ncbi:LysR family transcriptional regulator [Micromonospora sp. CA-263727]|uniref:LysR family transcriptional regulator n=1 Tax=Micromonospora sp. CA-263727 TaxID=3239967 RepID=UPI003D8DC405